MKKITKEELEKVVDFQNKLYKITTDIGVLESQKHAALHDLAGFNQEQEEYKECHKYQARYERQSCQQCQEQTALGQISR